MTKEIGNSELMDTWASDGLVVEPSTDKIENGWDLGEQPPHEYENWIQNTVQQKLNHILQNGVPEWNATTPYRANDYAKSGGIIYRSLSLNTNSLPPNANWIAINGANVKNSIEIDDESIQLVGDEETPPNSSYYGTDDTGARGYHPFAPPASAFETGDLKWSYGSGARTGYVRANGNTIGNASSSATERANADTAALFSFLWTNDTALTVSGGRGANAAADFAANKRINLPDFRSRIPVFLDGMGAANTNRVTTAGSGIDATTTGSSGGAQNLNLTVGQLPSHDHDGSGLTAASAGAHAHTYTIGATSGVGTTQIRAPSPGNVDGSPPTITSSTAGTHTHTISGTTEATGSGDPVNKMPPVIVAGTIYLKL